MEEDKFIQPSILRTLVNDNEKISRQVDKIYDLNSNNSQDITILKEKVLRLEENDSMNRLSERQRSEESNLLQELKKWKDYINEETSVKELSSTPNQINELKVKFNSLFKTGVIINAALLTIIALMGSGLIEVKCNSTKSDNQQTQNNNNN